MDIQMQVPHRSISRESSERLRLIATFLVVADNLSFAAAAQVLGITPSSVSRQILKLEQSLGMQLFHRTTRRVHLTEPGQYYHDECQGIFEKLADIDTLMSAFVAEPRGVLRLSAPVSFGRLHLAAAIAQFQSLYQQVDVEAVFEDEHLDLLRGGYDLAVRTGPLLDSALIARKIAQDRRRVVASARYVARFGAPSQPEDLELHNCLLWNRGGVQGRQWSFKAGGDAIHSVEVAGRFVSNNADALLEAARAGQGIALLPGYMVETDLREGQLIELLPNFSSHPEGGVHIVYPANRQVLPKVRAFIRFMERRYVGAPWNTPG